MHNLIDLFESFGERGEVTAFVYRTGVRRFTMSYRELYDLSRKMSRWLADRGVMHGDRVLLWGPNSPWWAVAFWGIVNRGAVAVPVDFMSDRERAGTICSLTEAKLAVQSRFKLDRVTGPLSVLLEELEYLLPGLEPLAAAEAPGRQDMAQLIYTSGTTGNPKGVILTHGNLAANLDQVNLHLPVVTSEFNFLSLLPLSHMFEQMGGFFTPLNRGATIVYLRTLKPSAIMEALAEEDIYALVAVPRLLQLLKTSIERELETKHLEVLFRRLMASAGNLSQERRKLLFYPVQRKFGRNFEMFVSGGAPLDRDVFRFWDTLGFKVVEGYGLTECSPVLTANTMERQAVGSVGLPLPGIEVVIANGEIIARGENIFPGYYRNESATREVFTDDGWFRTGDLGEFSPDGWLTIKGRAKELIVTGAGINVYPDELESLLNRTAGVRESCVIGFDRGGGEEVHAVILPDDSGRPLDDIIREANSQLDSLHQITSWSLWTEAEFPKTTTLKIRKFLVRDQIRRAGAQPESGSPGDRLIGLIARITGSPAATIGEGSRLVVDLGLTSIARLELVNYLEQEYRLDLEDSVIGPSTTVAELRRIVEKREKVAGRDHFRLWTNAPIVRSIRRAADVLLIHPVLSCFVSLEVKGAEHLAKLDGPVFFVANHTSYFDQPAVMRAFPSQVRYRTATAAWEEFFFRNFSNLVQQSWKRFLYEACTWLANVFPLPQSGGFRGALRFMGKLADRRINILIFPEGERTQDGRMLPFKLGLGIMVNELKIPVVPVRIEGLEQVLPRDARWPRRGRVMVTFGEQLRFSNESPGEIVGRVRQAVEDL